MHPTLPLAGLSLPLAQRSDAADTVARALAGLRTRNAVFFGHSAQALAQYGERDASTVAVSRLAGIGLSPGYLIWLAASAQAIGHLENAGDLPSLVDMVLPDKGRASPRGRVGGGIDDYRATFAAAAIGAIGDRDPLGFAAQIARGMNYTPREPTISHGTTGIFDIMLKPGGRQPWAPRCLAPSWHHEKEKESLQPPLSW